MRITWWLTVADWKDWANRLLDYGFYAHTHYDQNLLLADPTTKKYSMTSVNCDLLILDRELFPIPDGYVEYDSNTDRYKIYYWTALQDLINIAKEKRILIANTGGMFSWYCCTRKGLIPSDISEVDVEFAWGWETVSKNPAWGNAEATQDIWTIGDKGQRCLYYYIKGVDPHASIQGFTDNLYAPLPFTGLVYSVPRAVKADPSLTPNAIEIGMTPLNVVQYTDGKHYSVTAVNFNYPIMIYGIKFSDQYDAINVIIDLMTGITSVMNYSIVKKIPIEILDMSDDPLNFAWSWVGATHLKLVGKIVNTTVSKISLSINELVKKDLFVKIPKEIDKYVDKIVISEEIERKILPNWSEIDSNTWVTSFTNSEDFTCDFNTGVVRLFMCKLNVKTYDANVTIRLRAYTDDENYFEEERSLWNWHCYKEGDFWIVWAICAVPNSRYGNVIGNPNVNSITKVEIYISDTSKVTLDTDINPFKVTTQKLPRTRYAIIERGSYYLITWWNSSGNFEMNPSEIRIFIITIQPTPFLDVIQDVANKLTFDPVIQQIKTDAQEASFYYEVRKKYDELMNYLDSESVNDINKFGRYKIL